MKALAAIIIGFLLSTFLGKMDPRLNVIRFYLILLVVALTTFVVLYHLYTMEMPEGSWY